MADAMIMRRGAGDVDSFLDEFCGNCKIVGYSADRSANTQTINAYVKNCFLMGEWNGNSIAFYYIDGILHNAANASIPATTDPDEAAQWKTEDKRYVLVTRNETTFTVYYRWGVSGYKLSTRAAYN